MRLSLSGIKCNRIWLKQASFIVDPICQPLYSDDMNADNQEKEALDLKQLELRVEELIDTCATLKNENQSLRQHQGNLMSERAKLIEKTELARSRVEAMINRLKAMENNHE